MLHNDLENLNKIPFHMPGHKRNPKFGIIGAKADITEIQGYDNLHAASGSIKEIENSLAKLYSAKRSFLLVNGSTVGLLSAIFAAADDGDKIIIARNCHKSIYSACLLRHLNVVYAEPKFDEIHEIYTELEQSEIDRLIELHPDAKAIVLTMPTYEGITSCITAKIPIIADGAHAAHFPFGDFPKYPSADIVISSLHKTLPSLTQTAVANIYNEKFTQRFKFFIDIFETSSPSYLLMASASRCCEYLHNSKRDFAEYSALLDKFYSKTKLRNLSFIPNDDKSRICVSTASCSTVSFIGMVLTLCFKFDYDLRIQYYLHCAGSLVFSASSGAAVFLIFLINFKKSKLYAALTVVVGIILTADLIFLIIFQESALIEGVPVIFALISMPIVILSERKAKEGTYAA